MDLLSLAISDNVDWCAKVSPGGGSTHAADGVWLAAGPPPPLFPDAITMRAGVSGEIVNSLLADRGICSVKDSFADVDLVPFGFKELFAAYWIGLDPQSSDKTAGRTSTNLDWSQINDPAELAIWS